MSGTKTKICWYEDKRGVKRPKSFAVHLQRGDLGFTYGYCKTDHGWFWCVQFNSRWQVCPSCLSHFLDEGTSYTKYGFALDEAQAKESVRGYITQVTCEGKPDHHYPRAYAYAHHDWVCRIFQRSRLQDLLEGRPLTHGIFDANHGRVFLDMKQIQVGVMELIHAGLLVPTGVYRRDWNGTMEVVFTVDPKLSEKQVEKRLAELRKRSA